jgi:hypothetical protein
MADGVLAGEAGEIVRRAKVALVATRSAKSHPFMTPLWFLRHAGVFYLMTGMRSWAGRNVTANGEITLLFGGERGMVPGRFVRLRGRATTVPGLPPWPVMVRLAARYYVAPGALPVELRHARQWRLRLRYYGASSGNAGHVRVVPTSVELLDPP